MGFADKDHPDAIIWGREQIPCTYKYYIADGDTPVRIATCSKNRKHTAEIVNYRTGEFEDNRDLLVSIIYTENHDIKEISKEEFYKKCDEYMAHWTPERIKAHEEQHRKNVEWLREQIAKEKASKDE